MYCSLLLVPSISLVTCNKSHCCFSEPQPDLCTHKQGTLVVAAEGSEGLCTRCCLIRCLPGEISFVTRAGN